MSERNLSADGFVSLDGKTWSAIIREHPARGGPGVVVWEKHGMRSEYHADTAMEAAWRRLMKQGNGGKNDA